MGQREAAILELGEAIHRGYTDGNHIRDDEDLASLRNEPRFNELLTQVGAKKLNAATSPSTRPVSP